MSKKLFDAIKQNKVEFVDLRFSDLIGKHHHITLPTPKFNNDLLRYGKPFDGSSIIGWKGIENSDMVLQPDPQSFFIDPFRTAKTMVVLCDIHNPDGTVYNRDPRGLAKRAEKILKQSKIADKALFGPELEFFVFDQVAWENKMGSCFYEIRSDESAWGTGDIESNNGHRPQIKGGYFPVPPVDTLFDLRSHICQICEKIGLTTEVHHHEVGNAGQCEIGTKLGESCGRSDSTQIFKYIVKNVSQLHGKIATFMPKPIAGDNGSGMHVHISMVKGGKNIFSGKEYSGLSKTALHFIAGILKHAQAINAFTNPTTNSYKRLIPGFEAPTILGYSALNRSVSIRIPHTPEATQRRIEVRFPDSTANSYLALPAMLCAGLDGIKHKLNPGKPLDGNMYALPEREANKLKQVAATLNDAMEALNKDRKFLTDTGIFDDDIIDAYIDIKIEESKAFRSAPHPVEFDMYFAA